MARDEEVTALRSIEDAYQQWTVISEQLHQQVAESSAQHAGAPMDALRADFNAQLTVTRAVVAFARTCPASGPDVEGLPGAAFIQALYQVVASQPDLQQELAELNDRWVSWLAEVGRWTPALDNPPPARPISPALSRVLAAVDDWWGFAADRLHDQIVQSMLAQGHHVTETVTTGVDGEIIQTARMVFEPGPHTDDTPRPASRGPLARLRTVLGHRDGR